MSFTVQMLPDTRAILLTLSGEYNLFTDFPKSYAAVCDLLDGVTDPVYYIMDISQASFDLNVVIDAAHKTSRDNQGTFHHPMVKGVLIVSPEEVIHRAAEGLRSDVYGNVDARAFYRLEDALDYAHSN